jgi:hypothetical protein
MQCGLETSNYPVPSQLDSKSVGGAKNKPIDFDLVYYLDPAQWPLVTSSPGTEANNDRFAVPVEESAGHSFKICHSLIQEKQVLFIGSQNLNILNIAEGGLLARPKLKPTRSCNKCSRSGSI